MVHQLPLDPRQRLLGPGTGAALAQAKQNPQATGGILPLAPISPTRARQSPAAGTSPQPAALQGPTGGAQQPRTRADLIREAVPQLKDNPLAAIGFVLQSVAAGATGQPPPINALIQQRLAQRQFETQQAITRFGVINEAIKQSRRVAPEDQERFFKQFGNQFEQVFPGITELLADQVDLFQQAGVSIKTSDLLATIVDANPFVAEMIAESPIDGIKFALDNQKVLLDAAFKKNRPIIEAKFGFLQDTLQKASAIAGVENPIEGLPTGVDGRILLTRTDLQRLNTFLGRSQDPGTKALALSQSEMFTLLSDDELARSLGISIIEDRSEFIKDISSVSNRTPLQKAFDDLERARVTNDRSAIDAASANLNKVAGLDGITALQRRIDQIEDKDDPLREQLETQLEQEKVDLARDTIPRLQANIRRLRSIGMDKEAEELQARIDKLNIVTGTTEFDPGARTRAGLKEKRKATAVEEIDSSNVAIAKTSNALSDIRANPESVGAQGFIRATFGAAIGSFLGAQSRAKFDSLVNEITGGEIEPARLAEIRADLQQLVAQSITVVTGETSGRFTEAERDLTNKVVAALITPRDVASTTGALTSLLRSQIVRRHAAEIIQGERQPKLSIGLTFPIARDGQLHPQARSIIERVTAGQETTREEKEFEARVGKVQKRLAELGFDTIEAQFRMLQELQSIEAAFREELP